MDGSFRRVLLLSVVSLLTGSVFADNSRALVALNEGRVDDATNLLQTQLSSNPHDGQAHQLLCRVFYAQESFNPAIRECEAAVADAPEDSDNHLWLGRAYGMKASQANPISAFTLARKVVAEFERAVELSPSNVPALSDLGEYYVTAPAVVGGGLDKAQQLSMRMMPISAAKAHRLLAQIAEKKGDLAAAEAEYKRAVDAQRSPETYVDLAQFYQARKQYDQAFAAVQAAIRTNRPRDASAVDATDILIAEDRSTQVAGQVLREYLASPARSDAAPAFKVLVKLGDLLLKNGDRNGAKAEYDAALTLAAQYSPARKALQNLERQSQGFPAPNAIP